MAKLSPPPIHHIVLAGVLAFLVGLVGYLTLQNNAPLVRTQAVYPTAMPADSPTPTPTDSETPVPSDSPSPNPTNSVPPTVSPPVETFAVDYMCKINYVEGTLIQDIVGHVEIDYPPSPISSDKHAYTFACKTSCLCSAYRYKEPRCEDVPPPTGPGEQIYLNNLSDTPTGYECSEPSLFEGLSYTIYPMIYFSDYEIPAGDVNNTLLQECAQHYDTTLIPLEGSEYELIEGPKNCDIACSDYLNNNPDLEDTLQQGGTMECIKY